MADSFLHATDYRGLKTFVANFFGQTGKGFTFHAKGYGGGTNPAFTATLGGTTIWDTGALADVGMWSLDLDVVCTVVGASGYIRATGRFLVQNSGTDAVTWPDGTSLHTADISMNTTAALAFDFLGDNSFASGYMYCTSAWIEEHD